jgi:hypothetical protein
MVLGSGIRDPRSGIRKKPIPDPGSRGQKAPNPGSRIRIRNTALFVQHVVSLSKLSVYLLNVENSSLPLYLLQLNPYL